MRSVEEMAKDVFKRGGGTLATGDALAAGIHPRTLYALRDAGEIERLAHGLYRLATLPPLREPEMAVVARKIPRGVVCLISALSLHGLTTQIPHEVYIALPRNVRRPATLPFPCRIFRYSEPVHSAGLESRAADGTSYRVYDREKTLADCFKFRNKIGLDVAIEALREYGRRPNPRYQRILEYARICRVDRVMRPYLEAMA